MRTLWICQSVTMLTTVVTLAGWYLLPAKPYNDIWSICDLIDTWTTLVLAFWIARRTHFFDTANFGDLLLFCTAGVYVDFVVQEWWSYDPIIVSDWWPLFVLRNWLNFILTVILIAIVYAHTSASSAEEEPCNA